MNTSRHGYPFFPLDPAVENQVPVIFDSALVKDSGFILDNEITRDNRPTLNGYAGRGVTLEFYQDGVLVGTVETDKQTGYFEFPVPDALSGGKHQFIAQVAGVNVPGEPFDMIVQDADFVPVTLTDIRSGREFIWPEEATEETRPTFTGKGKPGSIVEIFDNGERIGTAVVGINKKWSFTPDSDLAPGEHDIVVKSGAGNESFPTHLTISGETSDDHAATDTLMNLNLHDLLSNMPMNLFQDAEVNPVTQQYELVIGNDDLQQSLTQSGIADYARVLTEQDLQMLLNDGHV